MLQKLLEKKILYKIVPAVLVSLILIGGYLYYASSTPTIDYTKMSLLNLYAHPNYQQLVRRIESFDRVLFIGQKEDGMDLFLAHYTNLPEITQKYNVRQQSLTENFLVSETADKVQDFWNDVVLSTIWSSQHNGKDLWVIDNRHTTLHAIDMDKLNGLLSMHPEDKVIVLSQLTFQNLQGFKTIRYQRPSEEALAEVLKQAGFDKDYELEAVLSYFQNDYAQLSAIFHTEDPRQFFVGSFQEQTTLLKDFQEKHQSSKPVMAVLGELCENGAATREKEVGKLRKTPEIVGWEDGVYYWADYRLNYAYIFLHKQKCAYASQISNYIPLVIKQQQTPQQAAEQQPPKQELKEQKQKSTTKKSKEKSKGKAKSQRKQKDNQQA